MLLSFRETTAQILLTFSIAHIGNFITTFTVLYFKTGNAIEALITFFLNLTAENKNKKTVVKNNFNSIRKFRKLDTPNSSKW